MENKQYTRDEVYGLMCKAFEHGFKKYDVVDAGLESKETDIECAWILHKHDIESNKKVMETKQTAVEWLAEKYNYVTWMRTRDEISAGLADKWRKHYLEQAKEMEASFITEIDHRLSVIEDYAKGEAGDEITKLRKHIEETYGK